MNKHQSLTTTRKHSQNTSVVRFPFGSVRAVLTRHVLGGRGQSYHTTHTHTTHQHKRQKAHRPRQTPTYTHTLHPASARFHTTSQGPSGRTWTKKGGGRRSNRRGGKRRRKGASGWPEIVRGGATAPPQREELPPRRGGRKAPGGIASRPPLLGGGGIEVPLVSLRHPNNFDFFRPRRREKQQRRRVRTLFAVSPHKKNLQNAWLLWVLRFSVSWVCRVFCFVLRSAGAAPKNRNEEKQGQGVAKEKNKQKQAPEKKSNDIVMGCAFCGGSAADWAAVRLDPGAGQTRNASQ